MDEQACRAAGYLADLAFDWTVNRPPAEIHAIRRALLGKRFTRAERQRVARFVAVLAAALEATATA